MDTNTLESQECRTVLRSARELSTMLDDEIKDTIRSRQQCEGTEIRILRSTIGMKCHEVAFPVKMEDFYVGQGSFGFVSMYRELLSGRRLSVKATRSFDRFSQGVTNDLLACREVRKSISHCVLGDTVAVYRGEGFLDDEDVECYDYIPGKDMSSFLDCNDVSNNEKLLLAIDIATGLVEFHKRKLLYRDMDPKNVIITPQIPNSKRRAVIIDFDLLTNLTNYRQKLESGSESIGSITPPEALACELPSLEEDFENFAFAYDAYSFGMTLVFLFEGRAWIPQDDNTAIPYQVPGVLQRDLIELREEERELIVDLPDSVPHEVYNLIMGLLKLNWKERISVSQAKKMLIKLEVQE